MAHATSQGIWLQVPALEGSETQAPSDCLSCYNSCLEHYRTCRRVHAGARLLGAISFYQVKRFQLYAGQGQYSSYEDWAQSFKNHPDNPELRTADMEWLARAGGIMAFVLKLEDLPDQGRRADYVLQEVGGLTQLKAVFPKVFNKRIPWNDGERLQDVDLLVYEFRRIKGALRVPGTIQQLYRDKWPSKAKKASAVTGPDTAEPMFPPAMQEEPAAAAAQAPSAAVAAGMGAHSAGSAAAASAEQHSDGSALGGSPGATSLLPTHTPAVTAPTAAAPTATTTTAVTTEVLAAPGSGVEGSNMIFGAACIVGRMAVSSAAVNLDTEPQLTKAAAAAAAAGCPGAAAGVATAAADGTAASGTAGANLQTAWSGSGDSLQEQEGQLQQPAVDQRNLCFRSKINLPAVCIKSREPSAVVDVAAPEPDSPAEPSSPFQQFLHVLIDDNKDSSAKPSPQHVQQEQQEQLQEEQLQEQQEEQQEEQQGQSAEADKEEDEHAPEQQQQQQSIGDDEDQAVSEDCQPPAAAAVLKVSATGRKGKRTCAELAAAAKPGPSKRPTKQQVGGSTCGSKAGCKAAGGGSSNVLTVNCATKGSLDGGSGGTTPSTPGGPITPGQQTEPAAEPDAAETASADDDSSMTDDSTIVDGVTAQQQQEQQQLLLHHLQQKRVLGSTLLQWMDKTASKIGLQITAEQAQQQGGLLNQVYVVTKWSDELKPLVNAKNTRTFMVIVVPEQQAPDADGGVNSAEGVAAAQTNDAPAGWKGEPAEWSVPKEMLTACSALKQRSGAEGDRIVASHAGSNLQLRHNDLACLRAPAWLSDECVNFYMALLQDRDSIMYDNRHLFPDGARAYRTYYFNTHFISKLNVGSDNYSYKEVQRWTSSKQNPICTSSGAASDMWQQQVLKYDRLVIPIHQRTPYQHWTVLLVDLVQQRLVFFDSYKTDNPIGPKALQRVKTWLKDEAKAKLGEDWDTSSWAEQFPTDTPRQGNDCDCGVFVLMACNRLGLKGGVFDFNQQDMVNIRAAVACDLVLGRIVASAHPNSAA